MTPVIIIFYLLFSNTYSESRICITSKSFEIYQTECNTIPDENDLLHIPKDINYLIIKCNYSNKIEKLFDLQRYPNLVFISISQCRIKEFTSSTFQNLSHLREVSLVELNFLEVPDDIFKNSRNIKRLSFIHLTNLKKISPFSLRDCHKIEEINLGGLNISTNVIHLFLLVVHKTLKVLTWNNNVKKLKFRSDYFKYFRLDELRLMRNKIDAGGFLENLQAAEVHLDFNDIGINFDLKNYKYLVNSTKILSIGYNAIHGVFPLVHNGFFANLQKLFINNNQITGFHKMFPKIFRNLSYLDASANRIVRLSESMKYVLKFRQVIFSNNPLFCGCELNWLWNSKPKIKIKCSKVIQANEQSDIEVVENYQPTFHSISSCYPPKTHLEIDNYKTNSTIYLAEVTLDLYSCEYIRLRCIAVGDPLPSLEFISLDKATFIKTPLNSNDEITISTSRKTIRHSQLSENSKYNQFYCIGTNPYGKSTIRLQMNKMYGKRKTKKSIKGIKKSQFCRERITRLSANNLKETFLLLLPMLIKFIIENERFS